MRSVEFRPVLGLWVTILALGVGSLIGGGLFGLTGFSIGYSGPSFLLVIALLALLNFPTVMAYAELALSIPDAGGGYIWIKTAFGPGWGHLAGWASWGAHMVACAVYALNIGYYGVAILTSYLLPVFGIEGLSGGNHVWIIGFASLFIVLWCLVNILGTGPSGKFGMYLVVGLLGVIGLYVFLGALTILRAPPGATAANFGDLFPQGAWGVLSAMGIFALAFQGSEIVAQAVKELKNPGKDLKRALFYSYGIIVAIYLVVAFVALGGIHGDAPSWKILAEAREGAIARSASFFLWGSMLFVFILVAGFVASLAALNSTIFSASHTAKALADAKSLPFPFRILWRGHNSPVFAIVVSAGCMLFMVIALPIEGVAAVANLLFIFLFLALNIALIKVRTDRPEITRPYKVPLFPFLNLAAIIGYVLVAIPLFSVSARGVTIFVIWFFVGVLVWFLFAKKNIEEEIDSAIIHKEYFPYGSQTYAKVFCPILKGTNWKALLRIAHTIAKRRDTGIYVCLLQDLPEGVTSFKEFGTSFMSDAMRQQQKEDMIASSIEFANALSQEYAQFEHRVSLHFASAASSDIPPSFERIERFGYVQIIQRLVEMIDADVLILPFEHISFLKRGFGWNILTRLLRQTRCQLLVAKIGATSGGAKAPGTCLVPYTLGPHGGLLLDVLSAFKEAAGLASPSQGGPLFRAQFLHIKEGPDAQRKSNKVRRELVRFGFSLEEFVEVEDAPRDIPAYILELEKDNRHDLLLLASSKDHWFEELEFGKVVENILLHSPTTTIVVHRHQEFWHPFVAPFARLYSRFATEGK